MSLAQFLVGPLRRCTVRTLAVLAFLAVPSVGVGQPPVPVPPVPGVDLQLPEVVPSPPPPVPSDPGAPLPAGTPDPSVVVPQAASDSLRDDLAQTEAEIAAARLAEMLPVEWPDLTAVDALPPIRDVQPFPDRPVPILLDLYQVTLIRLPAAEPVLDIVIGDSLFFETSGEGSEVYVKPMELPRRTSLVLTTAAGTAYSFDLFATEAYDPDVHLNVLSSRPSLEAPALQRPPFQLRFGTLSDLQSRQREVVRLRGEIARVEAEATRQLADIETLRDQRMLTAQQRYAESIEQRYWLSQTLVDPPLFVSQLWTDGQFTYLRSTAQEAPALYALAGPEGDEPVLVNYDLSPDGLYVVDHVMSAGWAQLGEIRGEWGLWERPDISSLTDLRLPVRPGPPDLAVPLPVTRAPDQPGFWGGTTGRIVGVVLVATAGYGLWRNVGL